MKALRYLMALPAFAATPALAAQAHKPVPKLSMIKARAIALKRAPGRIVDSELETEGGGLRYSFDIRQGKRVHEIGVDANTGRIVEDKYEGLHDKD